MFYVTDLDDHTQVVIEAETSSAFAKSDLEVRPDPQKALVNAISTANQVARRIAGELRDTLAATGANAEVSFSMKCDHTGLVMIAMNPDEGQVKVTLRFHAGPESPRPRPVDGGPLLAPPFADTADETAQ